MLLLFRYLTPLAVRIPATYFGAEHASTLSTLAHVSDSSKKLVLVITVAVFFWLAHLVETKAFPKISPEWVKKAVFYKKVAYLFIAIAIFLPCVCTNENELHFPALREFIGCAYVFFVTVVLAGFIEHVIPKIYEILK